MSSILVNPSRRGLIASVSAGVGAGILAPSLLGAAQAAVRHEPANLTNISYDSTRELYRNLNSAFAAQWKARTGRSITVTQSHGGSMRQQALVESGLAADVVTLAHPVRGLSRTAARPAPYTSTIAFLVRAGNPHAVCDWSDLTRRGLDLVTANPRGSAAGRWTYLSAWAAAASEGGDAYADDAVRGLYRGAAVLDTSASLASNTFIHRNVGDVLVTWDNEARRLADRYAEDALEVVYPSLSVVMTPVISLVDANVARHGTAAMAEAYVQFLHSEDGRPAMTAAHLHASGSDADLAQGPARRIVLADLGGWDRVERRHFGHRLNGLVA